MPPLPPMTHIYAADILKYDETPDGLLVHGKATGPDLDLDGQGCDPEWLKAAMPAWMRWGNVREMHGPIAAGVGKNLSAEGSDWLLDSLVVDANAANKVRTGVYKGYSIGIKNARLVQDDRYPNGRIAGGEIVEISLVDRPCNPTATIEIAKAYGAGFAPVGMAGDVIAKFDREDDEPGEDEPEGDEDPADEVESDADDESGEIEDDELSTEVDNSVDDESETDADKAARPTEVFVPRSTARPAVAPMSVREYRAALKTVERITSLNKAGAVNDESADIAGAQATIAQIARLIISEATELAAGRMEELNDIQTLCQAANSLTYFLRAEQRQDGQPSSADSDDSITYAGLSAEPDVTKRDFSKDQRDAAAKSGAAMPDGSFPIKSAADLKNAIRLAGNAKDPDAARAHIKARAKALGLSDQIPDTWKGATPDPAEVDDSGKISDDSGEITSKSQTATLTKVTALEAELATLRGELAKVASRPVAGGPMITNAIPTPAHVPTQQRRDPRDTPEYWERQGELATLPEVRSAYAAKAASLRASITSA